MTDDDLRAFAEEMANGAIFGYGQHHFREALAKRFLELLPPADEGEPITRDWLRSFGVFGNDADDEYETVADIGDGLHTIWGTPGEEVTHLGYSFKDDTAYLCCCLGNEEKEIIVLGPRKTRGEMRLLLRAVRAWDRETRPAIGAKGEAS